MRSHILIGIPFSVFSNFSIHIEQSVVEFDGIDSLTAEGGTTVGKAGQSPFLLGAEGAGAAEGVEAAVAAKAKTAAVAAGSARAVVSNSRA